MIARYKVEFVEFEVLVVNVMKEFDELKNKFVKMEIEY